MHNEIKRYENLMIKMNVPKERQYYSETNAMWFLRSGAIIYRHHQRCDDAIALAKNIIKQ